MITPAIASAMILQSASFTVSGVAAMAVSTITCTSQQIYVTSAGPTEARAKFQFVKGVDDQGHPVLRNFQGSLAFPEFLIKTFAAAAPDEIVNVKYSIPEVKSNPNYRPIKYKDSIQFKNIRATSMVPGSADTLLEVHWIVPKSAYKSSAPFQAVVLVDVEQNGARLVLNCK